MMSCLGYLTLYLCRPNVENDFDDSIADKLPTGTSLGLKALKMIDSTLETDLYSAKPYLNLVFFEADVRWAYSPLLATMNVVRTTSATKQSSLKYNMLTR